MVVTAYLEEAKNWQTLIGWVDHSTKKITAQSWRGACFLLIPSIAVFSGFTFGAVKSFSFPLLLGAVMAALIVWTEIITIRSLRKGYIELQRVALALPELIDIDGVEGV